MICDLHAHSIYSDGTCTPSEIIDIAEKSGISAIALTDHNTIDGLQDFIDSAKGKDIEIDAVRLINDDFDSILMDLKIDTYLKENIAEIIFGDLAMDKKRIAIRKLRKNGLSKEYMTLFLKLLDYINEF